MSLTAGRVRQWKDWSQTTAWRAAFGVAFTLCVAVFTVNLSIAELRPGQVVLDLGSGAGIDCFLASQQVGETGRVIGVDMTPEMLERARGNAEAGGYENVEFRLGEIEHLPVADASVDTSSRTASSTSRLTRIRCWPRPTGS